MRDLIFVSLENWDEIWRRNQFLCAALARHFPEMRILFVGLPRNVSHDLKSGKLGRIWAQPSWTVPGLPNVTVTHALKLLPDSIPAGRKFNEFMARRHIRRKAKDLGIKDPILWLNPYSALHMAGKLGERAVIYDITDDWPSAPSFSEKERKWILAQDRALCARADLVIVCSEALEASRRALCRQLLLLPNGVECEHYEKVAEGAKTSRWQAPVLGYTGTIHGDRFDVELLAGVAEAFPHGSIVLVGPDHLRPAEKERLAAFRNVHVTGPAPYAKIPEIMSHFDICIVPHVETAFTNSLNPLKLWEYLAAGKPIVSTNVAGFRDYPGLCRIATGIDAFVQACRTALEENGAHTAERKAEARKHSWEQRVDVLLNTLRSAGLINA